MSNYARVRIRRVRSYVTRGGCESAGLERERERTGNVLKRFRDSSDTYYIYITLTRDRV